MWLRTACNFPGTQFSERYLTIYNNTFLSVIQSDRRSVHTYEGFFFRGGGLIVTNNNFTSLIACSLIIMISSPAGKENFKFRNNLVIEKKIPATAHKRREGVFSNPTLVFTINPDQTFLPFVSTQWSAPHRFIRYRFVVIQQIHLPEKLSSSARIAGRSVLILTTILTGVIHNAETIITLGFFPEPHLSTKLDWLIRWQIINRPLLRHNVQ